MSPSISNLPFDHLLSFYPPPGGLLDEMSALSLGVSRGQDNAVESRLGNSGEWKGLSGLRRVRLTPAAK